jgi:hypothetical protein
MIFSLDTAELPTTIERLTRLIACAAVLDLRAEESAGEYKPYFADRARQCRSWAADLRDGFRADIEDIAGGLQEFEALAL